MSILSDLKKGFKGSKKYQEEKAKRKAARAAKKVAKQKTKNVKKISKMAVKAEKKEKGAGLKSVTIGKKSDPSKLSPTGKIRRKAKGVEVTEGGAYAKYGKKSKAAKSFRSEFAAARKAGKSSFSWDGRSYSTARADDKKKAAPPKVEKKKEPLKKKESRQEPPMLAEGGKVESYSEGGKVESNPYGWPSSDSRKR